MDSWTLTAEETPPATGSKVPVWIEDATGKILSATYAESLCDAGEDARGYWLVDEGKELKTPVRWTLRK